MDLYLQLVLACLAFILIYGFFSMLMGKKGTWSDTLPPPRDSLNSPETTDARDSAGEKRVRAFLEGYFNLPFGKVRPNFLENSVTGHNLELDCYNDQLKLACEYQGRQHYQYVPYFHRNKEAFYNQKYRDELKKIYCSAHGIHLLIVPYTEKDLENYLLRKLTEIRNNK